MVVMSVALLAHEAFTIWARATNWHTVADNEGSELVTQ